MMRPTMGGLPFSEYLNRSPYTSPRQVRRSGSS